MQNLFYVCLAGLQPRILKFNAVIQRFCCNVISAHLQVSSYTFFRGSASTLKNSNLQSHALFQKIDMLCFLGDNCRLTAMDKFTDELCSRSFERGWLFFFTIYIKACRWKEYYNHGDGKTQSVWISRVWRWTVIRSHSGDTSGPLKWACTSQFFMLVLA